MDYIIKPIRNDQDLGNALSMLQNVWNAEPGTKEADILDVLTVLVEAYEKEHCPIVSVDRVRDMLADLEKEIRQETIFEEMQKRCKVDWHEKSHDWIMGYAEGTVASCTYYANLVNWCKDNWQSCG